jgi:hypothetical protein
MKRLDRYFHEKSLMMIHLAFAVDNQSMQDSIYHLLCYYYHKDFAQKEYFEMMHNEREVLHTLMIL